MAEPRGKSAARDVIFHEDGTPRVINMGGEMACLACELTGTWEPCSYHQQHSGSQAQGLMQITPPDYQLRNPMPKSPPNPIDEAALRYAKTQGIPGAVAVLGVEMIGGESWVRVGTPGSEEGGATIVIDSNLDVARVMQHQNRNP